MLLVTETVKSDLRLMQKVLSAKVEMKAIETELQGLCDLVDYLEALPEEIQRATLAVRRSQGPEFKLSIAKALVEYRSDLDPGEKKAALESVKKVLENYIDETPEMYRSRSSTLRSLTTPDDSHLPFQPDISPEEAKSPPLGHKKLSNSSFNLLDLRGYLAKKVSNGPIYHQRYFVLKNGRLYWYKNESSYNAQGSLGLNTLEAVEVIGENVFKVTFEGRDLELRAENEKEMDTWVRMFGGILEPAEGRVTAVVFSDTSESSLFEEIDEFVGGKLSDRHVVSSRILSAIPKAQKKKKQERKVSVPSATSEASLPTPYRSASIDQHALPSTSYICFCIPIRRTQVQEPLLH